MNFLWRMALLVLLGQAATVALDTQAERMDLSPRISLLADPRGELHFSEVAAMESEFRTVAPQTLQQGFNAGVFWLRLALLHSGAQPLTRWLVVGTAKINTVTLFLQNGQDWQALRSGRNVALAEKPVVASDAVFPLTLMPGLLPLSRLPHTSWNDMILSNLPLGDRNASG